MKCPDCGGQGYHLHDCSLRGSEEELTQLEARVEELERQIDVIKGLLNL